MYYIIGLGNPGNQYQYTPHNIGRELLEELVRMRYGDKPWRSEKRARVLKDSIGELPVEYILPDTFMNRSGEVFRDKKIENAEFVIVIYDDISLPFGEIRLSKSRGDGGHNGIKSIEESLKSRSFIRFRVGVAPRDIFGRLRIPQGGVPRTNYLVGKKMSVRKRAQYQALAQRIDTFIEYILKEGYEYAVSKQGDL
ncbi:MAG: aminoacyl-tRNA hydrolase [Patescibacteria group bacterium]